MAAISATQASTSLVETNFALVRRFYEELVNHRKLALLPEVIASNFVDHIPHPVPSQPTTGVAAVRWFLETGFTAFPDLQVAIEDIIAAGDKVVTRVTWQGTQRGPLLGADPTGKEVRFTGIDIVRIADGKIVEHWGEVDVLRVVSQLGFMPI